MPRPLTVFYDGACDLCEHAMHRYRVDDENGALTFTDITDDAFQPQQFDRNRERFMEALHVRNEAGEFFEGIDAVAEIWRTLPNRGLRRFAAAAITLPGIHKAAEIMYAFVAKHRRARQTRRRPFTGRDPTE